MKMSQVGKKGWKARKNEGRKEKVHIAGTHRT
jgi:hypothetical protein